MAESASTLGFVALGPADEKQSHAGKAITLSLSFRSSEITCNNGIWVKTKVIAKSDEARAFLTPAPEQRQRRNSPKKESETRRPRPVMLFYRIFHFHIEPDARG